MKKFITFALTFATLITLAGCKPADNEYVKLAKKHGYWYGLGGISWGMTVDECVKILGVEAQDYNSDAPESLNLGQAVIGLPEKLKSDDPSTDQLVAKIEAYGETATVLMSFYDWSPSEKGDKYLRFIQITFEQPADTADELFDPIFSELETLGLTYEVDQRGKINPKTLSDLPQSEARDEAVAILQAQQDIIDENLKDNPPLKGMDTLAERPLDSIYSYFGHLPGNDFNKSTIFISGTTAALFASIEVGRTP